MSPIKKLPKLTKAYLRERFPEVTKWPTSMPVLSARDMCHGRMVSPLDGSHCLIGHTQAVTEVLGVQQALVSLLHDQVGGMLIVPFNDRNTLETNAAVWNAMVARLGYTEDVT
jgi:hypothetical protein